MLRDPARHFMRAVPGMPPEMRFPCVELPAVPLWGFTYRLIADWLGLDSRAALNLSPPRGSPAPSA
jgi:hypothetical protein